MNKITLGDVFLLTVLTILVIAFSLITQENVRVKQERQELKYEIQELNRDIGQFQNDLAWMEDYLELIEEIYKGKINEAILKERVKQLENAKNEKLTNDIYNYYYDYINQLLYDFDDALEITIYYFENTDQEVDLATYIATNYPALYSRLVNYA